MWTEHISKSFKLVDSADTTTKLSELHKPKMKRVKETIEGRKAAEATWKNRIETSKNWILKSIKSESMRFYDPLCVTWAAQDAVYWCIAVSLTISSQSSTFRSIYDGNRRNRNLRNEEQKKINANNTHRSLE